jgi:chemotaxis protein CheD
MAVLNNIRRDIPGPSVKGFTHVNRYWDRQNDIVSAKILPGEYYVTNSDEIITTVLGSCISACIRDRVFGIGGMNHFMLPDCGHSTTLTSSGDYLSAETRYGSFAMERLINDILKNGGRKENLEIKIIGGGRIIEKMTNVGLRNIEFARSYIKTEGFEIAVEDVGDIYPRKVIYFPLTGKVRVKKLRSLHNNTIIEREDNYMHEIEEQPVSGDVELF